jgi:ABC-type bacteriocin/lantibiotic exporter with double-glycine peptidase domain
MMFGRFRFALAVICLMLLGAGLSASAAYQDSRESLEVKSIRQLNGASCGLACLVSILDYWGVDIQQQDLLRSYPPDHGQDGYSLGRLKAIAQQYSLEGYALFSDLDFLRQQLDRGRPVLVALVVPYNLYRQQIIRNIPIYGRIFRFLTQVPTFRHFVVVRGIGQEKVKIMDPMYGLKTLPREAFQAMWDKQKNAMLLVAA